MCSGSFRPRGSVGALECAGLSVLAGCDTEIPWRALKPAETWSPARGPALTGTGHGLDTGNFSNFEGAAKIGSQ